MNKQSYLRQITAVAAAVTCMAAIAGCRASSTQAQADPNNQVPPCVATKTCPGMPGAAANPAAVPPTAPTPTGKLPGQP